MIRFCRYAASIGGVSTLTGTGPNLVMAGFLEETYPEELQIGYLTWMLFAVPVAALVLSIVFCVLCWLFACERDLPQPSEAALRTQLRALGPESFHERVVKWHFVALAMLWLLRKPRFVPGWGDVRWGADSPTLNERGVSDSSSAVLVALSLFAAPACSSRGGKLSEEECERRALSWEQAAKIPWGIVILLGGGFALAEGFRASKLSEWIGRFGLGSLAGLSPHSAVFAAMFLLGGVTNLTSNVATATIAMPILASLAQALRVHPLTFIIPGTVACSFAFILPVATPPNAMAMADRSSGLSVADMIRAGALGNALALAVLPLMYFSLGAAVFGAEGAAAAAQLRSAGDNITSC